MAVLDFRAENHTLSSLLGNGRKLVVPRYQRNYAWGEENWEELWEDLMVLRRETKSVHFMGSVVLRPMGDARTSELIDGQQRVTTCLLLILAAIEQLKEMAGTGVDPKGEERAEILRNQFVSSVAPGSLLRLSKLQLNRLNDDFLQRHLIQFRQPGNLRKEPKSNRELWNAVEFFRERFRGDDRFSKDGTALADFVDETVSRRLQFVGIEVADHLSAYRVFETLNARGVRLSPADLIKNWIFSQFESVSDQDQVERIWEETLGYVGAEKFTVFLRHYFCQFRKQVRAQDLFDLVRKEVSGSQAALQFLHTLAEAAGKYSALQDPDHPQWNTNPQDRRCVEVLRMIGTTQVMPPLLSAMYTFEPGEMSRTLKIAVNQAVRYNATLKANTHQVEGVFNALAKRIRDGEICRAREFFAGLKDVYPDDDQFRNSFAIVKFDYGANRKLLGYLVAELEEAEGGTRPDTSHSDFTIEHIEPESSEQDWTDRLGNLIPLENSQNKRCARLPFEQKRLIYGESRYLLAQTVSRWERWGYEEMESFQKKLAKLAVGRWRDDF
jgi:hypothetical protein